MRNTIQKIKELRSIEPRKDFIEQSRMLVLTSKNDRTLELPSWNLAQSFNVGIAVVLTSLLVIVSFGSASLVRRALIPASLTGLDSESFTNEASALAEDININLDEARYYTVTAEKSVAALEEASVTNPGHLSTPVIEKEIEGINVEGSPNSEIDSLLDELIL